MVKKQTQLEKKALRIMEDAATNSQRRFKHNIEITGKDGTPMEDFRKMGMGLRQDIDAGVRSKYIAVTSEYYILPTDQIINATTGTFSVFLPTAAKRTGKEFIIKNTGTGVITIDGFGSETIDGALTIDLAIQYDSTTLVSDSSNWIQI